MSHTEIPKVLIIDDDEYVREVLHDLFEALGWKPTTVGLADEAPAAFLRGNYDLITLDYSMPGINGRDLHRIFSEEFGAGRRVRKGLAPHRGMRLPPILLITAYADRADVAVLQFREGIVGTIGKPFKLSDVRDAAEAALGRRRSVPNAEGSLQ